jgi:hypothetical protein
MYEMNTLRSLKARAESVLHRVGLPASVKEEVKRDRKGLASSDPGAERVVEAAIRWLCQAQDSSPTADGGVARDYSLIKGWSSSYPETTGYIIPTFIDYAGWKRSSEMLARARRMLDWLVSIQMPCGAFQGGKIDSKPIAPVAFNTGQILFGLVAGEIAFGKYGNCARRAADWLVEIQDSDGCWRKHSSPFAAPGEKTYDTHIAWALFEAARIEPRRGYGEAGLANARWALTYQRDNGWIDKCCLDDPSKPFTHTIGYALRGIVEAYTYANDSRLLDAACRMADGLVTALRDDGFLPGRLAANWDAAVNWSCLTGTAQVAICWLKLFQITGRPTYREAAFHANGYLRRTIRLDGNAETRGGVKGSFPIDGEYNAYEYPNWAAKFLIDSLLLEFQVRRRQIVDM